LIVENANRHDGKIAKLRGQRDSSLSWVVWTVSAAVLALIVADLLAVAAGVVRPIVRMTGAMQQLAKGKLAVNVPFAERRDEVGSMASATKILRGKPLWRTSGCARSRPAPGRRLRRRSRVPFAIWLIWWSGRPERPRDRSKANSGRAA